VTVRARSTAGSRGSRADLRHIGALAAPLILCFAASPACGQVNGSVDVESDYRLRGYSLSAGQPVATAQIGYDAANGVYLNLSATGEVGRDDPLFLGVQGNIGYARRLNHALTIDGGIVRSQYRSPDRASRPHNYTEIYLGLASGPFSARVYYSPDYDQADISALYAEVEATFRPATNWRVNGHLGSQLYLATPAQYLARHAARYDWRLGVARELGRFDLHAALSGGGPGKDHYSGSFHGKVALTAGAAWNF
jgi:uncharacterized protein (TIGR02001 family)